MNTTARRYITLTAVMEVLSTYDPLEDAESGYAAAFALAPDSPFAAVDEGVTAYARDDLGADPASWH